MHIRDAFRKINGIKWEFIVIIVKEVMTCDVSPMAMFCLYLVFGIDNIFSIFCIYLYLFILEKSQMHYRLNQEVLGSQKIMWKFYLPRL